MRRVDVLVLGAGIVGVSAALHLLRRGRSVALIDRRGPGEETSYGNAGLVERSGFVPISFPSSLRDLWRYAANRGIELRYDPKFLIRILPWLWRLKRASSPAAIEATARLLEPLLNRAVAEHDVLARAAGAEGFFRDTGWLKLYRTARGFAAEGPEFRLAREFGARFEILDTEAVRDIEPSLAPVFAKAVFWPESRSVSSPGRVTAGYAARFAAEGGNLYKGDARSLAPGTRGWRVDSESGPIQAADVVAALGPWAPDVLEPLGLRAPLAVKRGYHRHFAPLGNAALARPVLDAENGYVVTPMERGIRLTTGIEFAARDAAPTPVQLGRALAKARELFPLGEPCDEPWLGRRPCFPDSLPVIGPAPGRPGLWLDVGHGHLGFTLGPVTGRLLAEMMTGAAPFTDPAPYRFDRFA
jgi:D-amino-acid dehydrogenase